MDCVAPTPEAQNGTENNSGTGSVDGNENSNSHENGNGTANKNGTDSAPSEEGEPKPFCDIPEKQRHQLKHRELFLSRQVETLPATHIRGKCVVTLLNETEDLMSYLNSEVSSTNQSAL